MQSERFTVRENKKSAAGACACILAAAALWGIIGVWNRRLMAGGLSPASIVVVRNFGGMALLSAVFALRASGSLSIRA